MAFVNPETVLRELDLTSGLKVMDIGAGSGAYAISLGRIVGDSGKVYAVDVQQELLAKLKKEAERARLHGVITIVWANAEKLGGTKLQDNSLDAVVLSNVLFQAENKKGMIEEGRRVLKLGGKMLIVDWSDSFGGLGPQQKDVLPKGEAMSFATGAHMSLLKEFDAGDHHYGFVFIKK